MEMTVSFPGGVRVDAAFGPHVVRTDQTAKAGGECGAPTPFQTFLASIATCAGYYVMSFCHERDIPTDGIRVTQSVEVDPVSHLVTDVRLDIHVPPAFPAKYHAALVLAANQCTVKKHLEHPPAFHTRTIADTLA